MSQIEKELGINPASPKQMKKLLIDDLGLPIVKSSKLTGAPSFDKEAMLAYDLMLESLDNPVAKRIKEFRGGRKLSAPRTGPILTWLIRMVALDAVIASTGLLRGDFLVLNLICSRFPKHPTNHGTVKSKSALSQKTGTFFSTQTFHNLNYASPQLTPAKKNSKRYLTKGVTFLQKCLNNLACLATTQKHLSTQCSTVLASNA